MGRSENLQVGDFRRVPAEETNPEGPLVARATYRIVGTDPDADVTLIRVTDADGTRRYTGDVATVPTTILAATEPASNPDAGLAIGHRLRNLGAGLYWSVRRFLP